MKPSKKTEWWEQDFNNRFNTTTNLHPLTIGFKHTVTPKVIKDYIFDLLHQRDNEIREKIRGMIVESGTFESGPDFDAGYNQALEEVLDYLSNREV